MISIFDLPNVNSAELCKVALASSKDSALLQTNQYYTPQGGLRIGEDQLRRFWSVFCQNSLQSFRKQNHDAEHAFVMFSGAKALGAATICWKAGSIVIVLDGRISGFFFDRDAPDVKAVRRTVV
ncbi:MAG: hypothetical protein MI861_07380, partial [Pirellulales bacterium]|nr:hypothetical protein [Pirellulales bacterium]